PDSSGFRAALEVDGNSNTASGNHVFATGNQQAGIGANGIYSSVLNNFVYSNGAYGIGVSNNPTGRNLISGNIIQANNSYGIYMNGTFFAVISSNTISLTNGNGISESCGSNNIAVGNTIYGQGNGGNGMSFDGQNNLLVANNVYSNANLGIA